jgi:predicted extracellular nuclease
MRIATFNVENLFSRAKAMNLDTWDDGEDVLTYYSSLNKLLQKSIYTNSDKQKILSLIDKLGLSKSDESKFVRLRQNRGKLIKRSTSSPPQITAAGRDSWIGWVELKNETVNETAIKMTAKVIQEVNADILSVIEAEDRISLKNFNNQLLKNIGADYNSIMLIDGNDDRLIDVGLMTKYGYCIDTIVSHVDDRENGNFLFSRDCPEFTVKMNDGTSILIIVNHFKSKGFGDQAKSNAKRKAQAQRVREIYDIRRSQGIENIAITGDFNDTPGSDPLSPLLANGSDLKDVFIHAEFDDDGRPGTFGNCTKSQKIDYILLSPELYSNVKAGGVCRLGIWGGQNGTLFPHFNEIKDPVHAASDHAAVWVDIEL